MLPSSIWHVRCKPDLARCRCELFLTPSLGPKFYIATADTTNQGSTLTYVDASAAMNVMIYSCQNLRAVWTIFNVKDCAKVASFLKGHLSISHTSGDPIHSWSIFLIEQLLKDLCKYGVGYYNYS